MTSHPITSLKTYWATWSALLALTLMMLWLDQAPMSRPLFVLVMLVAMRTKATLIAGTFMHLRFERVALVLMIVVGLLVNGEILFGLIVPDAIRIDEMGP
jgi:cytochrome c oxidase subunit IV